MNKNTLTFERKLYVAPACKTHVLELDGTLLADSDLYGPANQPGTIDDEDDSRTFGF